MSLVHVDERKWPDRLHWQFEAQRLGEDEHGVWLHAPTGLIAQRGQKPPMAIPHGFVTLVPDQEWWFVEFYWDNPRWTVYVNIGTVPVWDGDRVTQIDLDLDVIRTTDGTIEVVDEDEFQDHQVRFEYPDDLITAARGATERAVRMVTAHEEPFGSASQRWLEIVGHA